MIKLSFMDLWIKILWLADNEWVWEGNKFPCECNSFLKFFMTALQASFHFLEGFITWYSIRYLKLDEVVSQCKSVFQDKELHHLIALHSNV